VPQELGDAAASPASTALCWRLMLTVLLLRIKLKEFDFCHSLFQSLILLYLIYFQLFVIQSRAFVLEIFLLDFQMAAFVVKMLLFNG